ncbi:TetR/AcrR family transcriptional regulator [Nocardioides coralli]|uniref:TetR/AcrR family transcriptional regulator n=1 Tax=Nocardioides coralli TaxID=2872154 RepID=UPI002017F85F|nr:TetR/AcrR family transcriptional regulator [Nocardioides coralli]
MSTPTRAPRNTLSRELVVENAVRLADRDGLGSLTIRALAAECGARPMAIYHHIANKEAILDAIVDAVYAEVHLPRADRPWRDELAERSRSMRAALARHPWALAVLESRRNPGAETLRGHEACLEILRTAGFSLPATAHAYALLDAFVYGFAVQEAMLDQAGLDDDPADLVEGLDLSRFPRMAEFASGHVLTEGYSFGSSFEVGLELTLDSLDRLRHTY